MIVLDEQLLGYGLQPAIARWYRGTVTDITQLRPGTQVLDDAIPTLLHTVRQPTFVTINVTDFWRQMAPDPCFAIACFPLPHLQAREIPPLLRRLLLPSLSELGGADSARSRASPSNRSSFTRPTLGRFR